MKLTVMQIVVLLATAIGITMTYAAQFGFFSFNTGQVSDTFFNDVLIIPAGYAFSIWALIYTGFVAFAIYQALPSQRDNPRIVKTRPWFAASLLLNPVWVIAFEGLYFALSVVIIAIMLVLALIMHRTLEIGTHDPQDNLERVSHVPFSLYAAWLTAATVLNISGVLSVYGWYGFGLSDVAWAVIILLVTLALGVFVRLLWRDAVYGIVFVWTFVAIIVESDVVLVNAVAAVAVLVILLSLPSFVATKLRQRLLPTPSPTS